MEWAFIGIGGLILAILGDRWIANKGRVPLSKTRPDVVGQKKSLGMEATDTTELNKVIAKNDRLNAINGAKPFVGSHMNKIVPRLKVKRKQKDGPK